MLNRVSVKILLIFPIVNILFNIAENYAVMDKKEQRIHELQELLSKINGSENSEVHFQGLYKILKSELQFAEKSKNKHYSDWLKDISHDAECYIAHKSNKHENYRRFLDKFRMCVDDQLLKQSSSTLH
jgi:hypothetical protein